MDFKQLRSFVAVADCGSFTQAAAQLYTSQPTVSAHIRQLEEELQQRLFLRTTKSLSITPHGRELYDYAVQVLSSQDRLLAGWRKGDHTVSLGASTIPSAYLLPDLLARFSPLHPDVSFDIHQSDSSGVLRALRAGRFDLCLTGMSAPDDDLLFTPFYQDAMVLIAPNTPEFSAADPQNTALLPALLRSHPLLLREEWQRQPALRRRISPRRRAGAGCAPHRRTAERSGEHQKSCRRRARPCHRLGRLRRAGARPGRPARLPALRRRAHVLRRHPEK